MIKKHIVREGLIVCCYIILILLIGIFGTHNHNSYAVLTFFLLLLWYPIYLFIRFVVWLIRALKINEPFKGIRIVAVICFLESVMQIIGTLVIMHRAISKPKPAPILYFVIALYIACGVGLLKLKNWALYFTILLLSYKFIEFLPVAHSYILAMMNPYGYNLFGKIFSTIQTGIILLMATMIPILCIVYLARSEVREQFKWKFFLTILMLLLASSLNKWEKFCYFDEIGKTRFWFNLIFYKYILTKHQINVIVLSIITASRSKSLWSCL